MNEALLQEIMLAYETLKLVPIRGFYLLHEDGVDYACPIVCLAVNRGVPEMSAHDLAKDEAEYIALEWADRTFGVDFTIGLLDGFDGQAKSRHDIDYLEGHDLGVSAAQLLIPRDPHV